MGEGPAEEGVLVSPGLLKGRIGALNPEDGLLPKAPTAPPWLNGVGPNSNQLPAPADPPRKVNPESPVAPPVNCGVTVALSPPPPPIGDRLRFLESASPPLALLVPAPDSSSVII